MRCIRDGVPPKIPLLVSGVGALAVFPILLVLAWRHVYADGAYGYFQAARALAAGEPAPLAPAPLYVLLLALAARLGLPLPPTALVLSGLGWAVAVAAWLSVGWWIGSPAFGLIAALLLALHPLQGQTLGLETAPALGAVSLTALGVAIAWRTPLRRAWLLPLFSAFFAVGMMPALTPWVLLLGAGGVLRRRSGPTLAHLAFGAALPAGLLALETTLLGAWHDVRLLVPLSVALQILLAAAIAASMTRPVRPLALLAAVALCGVQAHLLWQDWLLRPTDRLAFYERVARWVRENSLPTDRIAAPLPGLLGYLADRAVLPAPADRPVDDLQALLESRRPDILLAPSSLPWQWLRRQSWFQEHYRPVHWEPNPYEPISALQVYQYVPSPFDVGETVTTTLTFAPDPDRQLELTAYRLDSPRLVPGWPVHLSLYWRAATALDRPLRLILYLCPESGGSLHKWAETTTPGGLPTHLWTPGVVVADRYTLFPPADLPAGDYRLELALYLPGGRPVAALPASETTVPLAHLYRPATVSTEPPRPDHPLRLAVGDGIELVGYDAPDWALRGQPFRVALYWHATGPIPANYKVFVHLLTADGQLLAQDDSEPVAWTYPTGRWRVGEYILDEHSLALPADGPRGEVWLSVGMYDPATGDRLPVYDEGGTRMPEDRAILRRIGVY